MKKDTSQDIYLYIIGWVGIGLSIIYLFLKYALHVDLIDFAGPCVLNMLTGFYCPGCGGTRAMFALAKGDILKSFVYQPFVPMRVPRGPFGIPLPLRPGPKTLCELRAGT